MWAGFWVLKMCALILCVVELQKIKLEFSSYATRHCWWKMNKQKHILLWSLVIAHTHKAHKSTSHRTALTQILISMQAEWYTTVSRFNGTCIFHLIYNWMWWWWCSQQTVHAFMLINDVIFIIIKCETKRTRSTPTLLFAVWVHCIVCTLLSAPSLCQFKWFTLLWCCKHNHGIFFQTAHHFFEQGYYDLFQIIIKRLYINYNKHLMLGLVLGLGLFSLFFPFSHEFELFSFWAWALTKLESTRSIVSRSELSRILKYSTLYESN